MASIIIRIILVAIFVAHFAMPSKVTTVTQENAPFTDSTLAGFFTAGARG